MLSRHVINLVKQGFSAAALTTMKALPRAGALPSSGVTGAVPQASKTQAPKVPNVIAPTQAPHGDSAGRSLPTV